MIILLPTPLALARLDEIQDETGRTVTAYGELIVPERRPSALFDMMCGITRDEADRLVLPSVKLGDEL